MPAPKYGSPTPGVGEPEPVTKKQRFSTIASLIVVPWAIFVGIVVSFTVLWYYAAFFVTVALVLVSVFALQLVQGRMFLGNLAKPVGVLCFVAIGFGIAVGHWNYDNHMRYFFLFGHGRLYTNVLASESAAAHGDASAIVFHQSAVVDVARSRGLRHGGSTYCVAPIIDPAVATEIQFWAGGVNCCGERASFNCGAVSQADAHAGVAVTDPAAEAQLLRAVQLAEADFDLDVNEAPLVLSWERSPYEGRDTAWTTGVATALVSSACYLLMSVLFGAIAHHIAKRRETSAAQTIGP